MQLPDKLMFQMHCMMRLGNGGHVQEYINPEFGIKVKKIKENRNVPWTMEITMRGIPDKKFNSIEELKAHLAKEDPQ